MKNESVLQDLSYGFDDYDHGNLDENGVNNYNSSFFSIQNRSGSCEMVEPIVEKVFQEIYGKKHELRNTAKNFKPYNKFTEHKFFKNFLQSVEDSKRIEMLINPEVKESTIDEIFQGYLNYCRKLANSEFFAKILKLVVLFREHINASKSGQIIYSIRHDADEVPYYVNKFLHFLEPERNLFDLNRETSIGVIQNLCGYLYENNFTNSQISLVANNQV